MLPAPLRGCPPNYSPSKLREKKDMHERGERERNEGKVERGKKWRERLVICGGATKK